MGDVGLRKSVPNLILGLAYLVAALFALIATEYGFSIVMAFLAAGNFFLAIWVMNSDQ